MTTNLDSSTGALLAKAIEKLEATLEMLKLSASAGEIHPALAQTLRMRKDWIESEHFGLLFLAIDDCPSPALPEPTAFQAASSPDCLSHQAADVKDPVGLIPLEAARRELDWANMAREEWRQIAMDALRKANALRVREDLWIARRACVA